MVNEFEIKSPKAVFVLLVILTVFLCMAFAGSLFLYLCFDDMEGGAFAFLILALSTLPLLGLCYVGFFVYNKEKFIFRDEIYTYIKPFRASQSIAASDIGWVEIRGQILIRVNIYDRSGALAMNFIDDGTSFRSGEFINSLLQRKIEIKYM